MKSYNDTQEKNSKMDKFESGCNKVSKALYNFGMNWAFYVAIPIFAFLFYGFLGLMIAIIAATLRNIAKKQ